MIDECFKYYSKKHKITWFVGKDKYYPKILRYGTSVFLKFMFAIY
jgi:hypothetical protein